MSEVRKLDSRRRAVFPDRFSPGDLFLEEEVSADVVVFRRVRPTEAPVVCVVERGGRLMIDVPVDADAISQAIREERDSR